MPPKWELCAKMTKAIVFFGAETPQRIPLCKQDAVVAYIWAWLY